MNAENFFRSFLKDLEAIEKGIRTKDDPLKVFDWDKAARIIVEQQATTAYAGLREDWENTFGRIYRGGPVADGWMYLASTWATPVLYIDGYDIECYTMEGGSKAWDANTVWPPSALAILNAGKEWRK